MSSFTPRSWKSQAEPQAERHAEPPVGNFHAYRHGDKPNNLPIASTTFVGRERDVAEVKALLERHRLVTLVGAGGIGKTRLALQVGTELLDGYPDGVWFVDLAPISDPELVSSVTARVLGMRQQEGRRVDESIPPWLERKKLLLIFDNCEHVVETVASLADAILATAQDVRIVATSRQALDIRGEEIVRIASLDVPHTIADLTAAAVMEFAAVALFVARATSVDRSFAVTDDTAPIVADICRRLDGIPLAIELAAARVKVLSIPHLAERLNERFKLLTGGSRSALPRQKTLSALLDWSYDLLTPQEQRLFVRLGIFAGGFGLDAAAHVCFGDGPDEIDILDLLGSLTDKSLVVADTSGEHERFRLLESTAAYALEKLSALGEREVLARRHAEYFRKQAEAADERFGTRSMFAWLARVELELDNYRTALTWALTQRNDPVQGAVIAGALSGFWTNAGLPVEGRYWIALALEQISEAQPRLAVHAQRILAFALYQMGLLDEARAAIEQALARDGGEAHCLIGLAMIETSRGNLRTGRELFAQALAAFKALGYESGAAVVLGKVAELEFADRNPQQALRAVNEALEIGLREKNAADVHISKGHNYDAEYLYMDISECHNNSAAYRIALGDLTGARDSSQEGLRLARRVRNELYIANALQHLALIAGLGGDARRGAQLLGYVDAQYSALGMPREPTEQWGYDKLLVTLHETLRKDELAQLLAEGAMWSEDRAVEEALQM